jgi:hypothetical protein
MSLFKDLKPALKYVFLIVLLGIALSWPSSRFADFSGWFAFTLIFVLASFFIWIAGQIIKPENPPPWLFLLTVGAISLRFFLGLIWFLALPVGGYDTDVQRAGYIMEDAFNRDTAAWELAKSDQPLINSFQGVSSTDQYGGLLFLSATIYRYTALQDHNPLLIVALAATVSGLAVAFTWAFTRRIWGDRIATLAAWGLALFPEAVLLGSSQMREAFTVCLVPLAIYGLLRFRERVNISNAMIMVAPILFSIPLTWAFTPSLILILVLVHFALDEWQFINSRRIQILLGSGLLLFIIVFGVFANTGDLWLVQSAKWQAYVSSNASGWIAREFEKMPVYAQVPSLIAYGMFRPILPAAIIDTGPVIWTAIGIWRALGWTALFSLLVYATYLILRLKQLNRLPGALLLASWLVSITASYRGGGDLWDNPRYRSAFSAIQIALAAWAWVRYREIQDPWMRRAVGSILLIVSWFIPWYLRRYTTVTWPISELHQVIGLGVVSSVLFIFWDWMRAEKTDNV